MSRNIVENGNSVWRYRQGQEDPMAFISLVHNIGEYRILEINNECGVKEYTADVYFFDMKKKITDALGDLLIIKGEDINRLKKLANSLESKVKNELELFNKNFKDADKYVSFEQMDKDIEFMNKNCPNVWFYKMIKSMVSYIEKNPKDEYRFLGEV